MIYLSKINVNATCEHPFPFNVPAVKFAKNIEFSNPVTFIIGENGCGKSTLLESLACRLYLPHMDGYGYTKKCFDSAKMIIPFLELEWEINRTTGFFFRAEDFGDLLNSVQRSSDTIHRQLSDLEGEIPKDILDDMKDSANYQLHKIRQNFGQDLNTFSHGEAYLHIMERFINQRGIYLLDEPEASLSPAKQLAFIYFIQEHLQRFDSQFIIATHSPILMNYPNATIYEVTENGMQNTPLEQTEHFSITKTFLNNPNAFLRYF